MSNSGGGPYYWCLRHNRVETDTDVCPASTTMGPYESPTEAEQALTRVAERNEQWDAEDARWRGETALATHPGTLSNMRRSREASDNKPKHTA